MNERYIAFFDKHDQRWEVRDQKVYLIISRYETEDEARRHANALNAPPAAFHWRNGLFFRRGPDGGVEIVRGGTDHASAELIASIPVPEWASIVCSVSVGGETGERWNAAQDFHGRTPATTLSR
ncbi:hypothetical protein [Bradyrhizobium yuanmingense]|uniref:hypothetical protein n=1 Tax=Bradyrhizobium yuanmingense TaxID=108015 RepID=UPI000563F2A0|nr:hypothetical protein [Bradyrhizobium yuanmingense]